MRHCSHRRLGQPVWGVCRGKAGPGQGDEARVFTWAPRLVGTGQQVDTHGHVREREHGVSGGMPDPTTAVDWEGQEVGSGPEGDVPLAWSPEGPEPGTCSHVCLPWPRGGLQCPSLLLPSACWAPVFPAPPQSHLCTRGQVLDGSGRALPAALHAPGTPGPLQSQPTDVCGVRQPHS